MTGNLLLDSIISIAAIGLMVLTAKLVFPAPSIRVTRAAAEERLALDEPDFVPTAWLEDSDARAALAANADGEFVLIARLGLDLVVRRFRDANADTGEGEGALIIQLDDPTLPKTIISHPDAARWARKLTAAHGKIDV